MIMAKARDRRIAQSWILLGQAAEMPISDEAVVYLHDRFHEEILRVNNRKFNRLKRVIGFAGAKARHSARLRGGEEISSADARSAVTEVSAIMQDLDPHFRSICHCSIKKN